MFIQKDSTLSFLISTAKASYTNCPLFFILYTAGLKHGFVFWTSLCLNQPKKDSGTVLQKQPLRTVKTIISSPTAGRGQHPCH